MRLCSYTDAEGRERLGQVEDNLVTPVEDAQGRTTVTAILQQTHGNMTAGLHVCGDPIEIGALGALLPCVPRPDKIICVGYNYLMHAKEVGKDLPSHPTLFTRYASSLIGHRQPLIRPRVSTQLDWEGELAVIIGKPGRNIRKTEAMKHVFGYSCFGDHSVRDYQYHSSQATAGKNFDGTAALGPVIVLRDDFGDIAAQELLTHVNGKLYQRTTLDQMLFGVDDLVAYISEFTELRPGDVIATGTPSGIGMRQEPPVWLRPGDQVDITIEGIGTLTNRVEDQ